MKISISIGIQLCIQFWLNTTGKKVDFIRYPFLKDPMANDENIGEEFYSKLAKKRNLILREFDIRKQDNYLIIKYFISLLLVFY